ncbi:glycoside hydrolase family 20 zincin-like fold domain-containing protein [Kriegella aquimaris]|uniref:beta-N-acetylhexosaminidase n=1 Tax=Kriegella aquimaris TaxID=192904 RepID=A0A1G9Y7F2_9FLAO|nr:glycoside hydrolase family 20 zincin-like fold domain-containing protein [Kriegella aquimaris]SDN05004.1 Glycosyl hydrolase family 20, catalytic domain [Kriegella aquimaris]
MSQKFFSLLFCISILVSCKEQDKKLGDFKVLPEPQEFVVSGVSELSTGAIENYYSDSQIDPSILGTNLKQIKPVEDVTAAQLVLTLNKALDISAEGYSLTISNGQISITGKDQAGLFYGLITLEQLLEDASEQQVNLPLCTIIDYPLLAYRAIHLDVKHHLQKTDYYYELMDKLASYKVNAIILEAEDKMKFKRQPIIGSADALSLDEWAKLSDYAAARNIEISPLVQGLGHASFILKHPKYKELRDDPSSDWAFDPLNPKTYDVQFDLYLDAIEATPHGKYLHVGGDEVHTTGRNSGKSALELQLMWLDKVSKFAEEHNRIPIFWDDMPLKQAEVYAPMFQPEMTQQQVDSVWDKNGHRLAAFLDQFPKNCIYMRWNYSSPEALGNTKTMDWFRENGLQVMGATAGQTRWVLMPQEESNIENIKSFALSSIESGSHGLLLTLWDDDSPHFELYNRGIIFFSEYTWSGEKRSNDALKTAYRQREFSHTMADGSNAFIDSLEKPVIFWKNALLKGNKRNFLASMDNALEEGVIDLPVGNQQGRWSEKYAPRLHQASLIIKQTDSIAAIIEEAKSKAIRNSYTLEVYEQVNNMTAVPAKLLLGLQAYDAAQSPDEKTNALKNLEELRKDFVSHRRELEDVYGKTRILNKPDNYILDQDHHVHLANQSINFDWQFYAEMLFFEKLSKQLDDAIYLESSDALKK